MTGSPAIFLVAALACLWLAPKWPTSFAAAEGRHAAVNDQLDAGVQAAWRDGEIRSRNIGGTGETEMSLGLLASGQHGTATLVLSARLPRRSVEPPGVLQVQASVGERINPNMIRGRALTFVLDAGTQRAMTIDLSERLRFLDLEPGTAIDNATATLSLVEFIQLLRSETVTGQVLGLDFSFTSPQRQSLREFGDRILRPSR